MTDRFDDAISGLKFIGGLALQSFVGGGGIGAMSGGEFSPSNISGLVSWLDASDAATITDVAGIVERIDDKSGNSNDAFQSNITLRPVLQENIQNGLSALLFDIVRAGVPESMNSIMNMSNSATLEALDNEITIFYANNFDPVATFLTSIMRKWDGTNDGFFIQNDGNGNGYWNMRTSGGSTIIPSSAPLRPPIFSGVSGQGNLRLNNGNAVLRQQRAEVVDQAYSHGNGFGSTAGMLLFDRMNGHLFEFMIYNRALTDAEVTQIETYLADKWGL